MDDLVLINSSPKEYQGWQEVTTEFLANRRKIWNNLLYVQLLLVFIGVLFFVGMKKMIIYFSVNSTNSHFFFNLETRT